MISLTKFTFMKKKFLKENSLIVYFRLCIELLYELKQLSVFLGIVNLHKDRNKLEAYITKKYHSIEKGLSLPGARVGFGEKNIVELIDEIKNYIANYPDSEFILKPIEVLIHYQEFNRQHNNVNKKIEALITELPIIDLNKNRQHDVGIKIIQKKQIESVLNEFDFNQFIYSRHSIRDFAENEVADEMIIEALKLANQSPSACNRQPWHTYVYEKDKKDELLNFQGGCRGFVESVNKVILVTSDLNCFDINEIHQAYIDGGIYSMNLIYGLHSLGIGTIPLTTGFKRNKTNLLYNKFNIPKNHVPVLIVGIGNLKDTFTVACSARKSASLTNVFIKD